MLKYSLCQEAHGLASPSAMPEQHTLENTFTLDRRRGGGAMESRAIIREPGTAAMGREETKEQLEINPTNLLNQLANSLF